MQKACETCGAIYAFSRPFEDHSVTTRGTCFDCFQKFAVEAALTVFRNAIERAPTLRAKWFLVRLLTNGAKRLLWFETRRKLGEKWLALKTNLAR